MEDFQVEQLFRKIEILYGKKFKDKKEFFKWAKTEYPKDFSVIDKNIEMIDEKTLGAEQMDKLKGMQKQIRSCDKEIKYLLWEEEYPKILADLKKGIIPKAYPFRFVPSIMGSINEGTLHDIRREFVEVSGFPLYAESWVKPLAKWIGNRKCLEIMAGSGYFSYQLKKYGVNVRATDNFTWRGKFDKFYDVENLDCVEAIKKYGKEIDFVICSWADMTKDAFRSLLTMREVNPKCRMIYIGESEYGCTADIRFFNIAEFQHLKTFDNAVYNYSCWEGIHDFVALVR